MKLFAQRRAASPASSSAQSPQKLRLRIGSGCVIAVLIILSLTGALWGLGWPRMNVIARPGGLEPSGSAGPSTPFAWWVLLVALTGVVSIGAGFIVARKLRPYNTLPMLVWVAAVCAFGTLATYSAGSGVAMALYGHSLESVGALDTALADGTTFTLARALPLGAVVPVSSAFLAALTYWTTWVLTTQEEHSAKDHSAEEHS